MKYHLTTGVLLLIAVAFYIAGFSGAGAVVFFVGVAFEAWFCVRIVMKRSPAKAHPSSTSQ